MKNQILLDADPFFIGMRIKEVDSNYFIIYNTCKNKFELHNSAQYGSTFALSIPYECLDERTIFLARKTRKENINKIISDIDRQNEMRDKKLAKSVFEQIKEVIYDN